jgi:hypothetical protein
MMNHDSITNLYVTDFRPNLDYSSTRFMSTSFKESRITTFRTRSPIVSEVATTYSRRLHLDKDFLWFWGWIWKFTELNLLFT